MLLLWATSPSSISFVAATEGGILEIFLIPRLLSHSCFRHNYLHPADYVIGSVYLSVCLSVSRITKILWTDLPFQHFFFHRWGLVQRRHNELLGRIQIWLKFKKKRKKKKRRHWWFQEGIKPISNESRSIYASGSSKSIQAWCRKKWKTMILLCKFRCTVKTSWQYFQFVCH